MTMGSSVHRRFDVLFFFVHYWKKWETHDIPVENVYIIAMTRTLSGSGIVMGASSSPASDAVEKKGIFMRLLSWGEITFVMCELP